MNPQFSQQVPLPANQYAAPPPALPPPPWAQADAAALAPLPLSAPEPSSRNRLLIAILVAVLAAVVGFFGVRIIVDLATDNASAVGVESFPSAPRPAPQSAFSSSIDVAAIEGNTGT